MVVELNEDLLGMKTRLCSHSPHLQTLPIFGMGGIGKTTLARTIYDDPLIREHFQIRAWVTVSQDHSERAILSDLLDSMKEFDAEWRKESTRDRSEEGNESLLEIPEMSNTEMALKVHKILVGRRFLIVMDDIWSIEVLDYAKILFPDNENGSRIMLTTRLANVAAYADADASALFHEMKLMDADQSWSLLSAHLDHIPPELESAGKEIARSCGGLPLAVVVVAGLLSTVSKTRAVWDKIASNVKSSLATGDSQIEKILSLSYNHLPLHLKPCFLYMAGFPEDHEIKVTDLIRLWVAEGFVEFEDTAEQYLEDLVDRSLVVVTKRKSDGRIKSCSLHDMVHEMCIKLAHQQKFFVHITGRGHRIRRISISGSGVHSFASTIRTILCFQHTKLASIGSLSLLRILDVLKVRFMSRLIPDQFFELFHLRYLAFCYDEQLSRAISNLQNLQALIIKVSLYRPLPHEIWQMPQLRHLIISGCCLLIPNANNPTFSLQNLQTLGKLKNLTCSISMLSMFPNLTKLCLTFFRGKGDLLLHNLVHLCRLEKLQLELETEWSDSGDATLVAPDSLKKLTLIGWGRYEPYIGIVGPLPNLQVLKLIKLNFWGRQWSVCDGDFPRLKSLLIDGSNLAEWNPNFPRLKTLFIRDCRRLSRIPDDIGEIPTLELVEVKLCAESLAESAREMQEEQRSYGNDGFQVRCIDCDGIAELKEHELVNIESVRKAKTVIEERPLSYRKSKRVAYGYMKRPKPLIRLDYTDAELKIVNYKEAEPQL
ncbi:putative late blight resistance protein homolog R1B-16 [Salvia hispanica]|uniref:putative late blight resistance protein homolog R1B-16 n=1 Tax=Salvia hispanica TaxID=49212 RepID=UPI00200935F0|nr:putative late blight resistance protein homolog R1B-16 [Salvia hispanica]XP_047971356.1 putative late blight resistance protein homolog R1B-16 [Salvia hispanica]